MRKAAANVDRLFLTVLNMSITGAFVIAVVCLARLPLKKAPKIISYCLWAVAGFRLICPFSIESAVSLIPFKAQPIEQSVVTDPDIFPMLLPEDYVFPSEDEYRRMLTSSSSNAFVSQSEPLPWFAELSYLWLFGFAVMLLYGIVSYLLLKRRMRSAIRVETGIYESDNVQSPFVLGVLRPKIYIPLGLSGPEREYILLHEQTHIRRCDHIVKFAAYFILCLHWFNPLAWVAFLLMGVDMEMSCDERVLKELGDRRPAVSETKHDYARSLLSLATEKRVIGGSPLAFSEGGLKQRIKNVLNFKKPSRVIIVVAVALVAVLSVGFAVNRTTAKEKSPNEPPDITVKTDSGEIDWLVGKNKWDGGIIDHIANFKTILSGTTAEELTYVENGGLIAIEFHGDTPQSAVLTEYILRETGDEKYNTSGMDYEIRIAATGYPEIGFTIKPNYATAFSSKGADYLPGNTIKGYRLVCNWGDNECEYVFVLRGDPAITTEIEQAEPPESTPSDTPSEEPSPADNPYKTRELSRDGDYKLMEMYVYDETVPPSKRITFELPVEWDFNSGSVFVNGESGQYSLKVDMGSVISATRDEVLTEFNNRDEITDIFSESIYSTGNFEVFQYKHTGIAGIGDGGIINTYYLYANGERFSMCAYVFTEDKPEYDEIIKRIAESVRFQ